jgi:hypothetical protein
LRDRFLIFNEEVEMKKEILKFGTLAAAVLALLTTLFVVGKDERTQATTTAVSVFPEQDPSSVRLVMPPLDEFTTALIEECGDPNSSQAMRIVESERLQRAAKRWLKGIAQHAFVALPCLETRMGSHKTMISTAGARGIVQLMPATAKAEAARCGYGDIKTEDLMDRELNLNIGACHFADLVEKHGLELAPCMYNGGSASETCKLAKRFIPGGPKETLGYAAIHSIIMFRFLLNGSKKPEVKKVQPKEPSLAMEHNQ